MWKREAWYLCRHYDKLIVSFSLGWNKMITSLPRLPQQVDKTIKKRVIGLTPLSWDINWSWLYLLVYYCVSFSLGWNKMITSLPRLPQQVDKTIKKRVIGLTPLSWDINWSWLYLLVYYCDRALRPLKDNFWCHAVRRNELLAWLPCLEILLTEVGYIFLFIITIELWDPWGIIFDVMLPAWLKTHESFVISEHKTHDVFEKINI